MYKIKEFSDISNTSIVTLRYYDEINLFKPNYVDFYSGYRYYEDRQIKIINKINKLKELGLSLEEIKKYIVSNDNEILINKMKGYEVKMKEIERYLNEQENKEYEVIKGDYSKYLELRGLLNSRTTMALEVRDDNADYYYIKENNSIIGDFAIYKEESWITLDYREFKNEMLIKKIFSTIKKDYKFINVKVPSEETNIIDDIRRNYKNTITEETQGSYKYTSIKIELY